MPLFDLDRKRKPTQEEPPVADRSLKPMRFRSISPERPKSEPPASEPKSEKTLYEELLELGDDFDINNLDLSK